MHKSSIPGAKRSGKLGLVSNGFESSPQKFFPEPAAPVNKKVEETSMGLFSKKDSYADQPWLGGSSSNTTPIFDKQKGSFWDALQSEAVDFANGITSKIQLPEVKTKLVLDEKSVGKSTSAALAGFSGPLMWVLIIAFGVYMMSRGRGK